MDLQADECMAFEDSENGILSSLGANLGTVITINEYTREHDFSDASIVLDDMGEPDQAFTVLEGDSNGYTYLNCEMISKLHQQRYLS